MRGEWVCDTGTNTRRPLTATVPLIVLPILWAHFCLPVFASRATTLPLFVPATTVSRATTGVPVKSPSPEK
jgi:hypothetical protein